MWQANVANANCGGQHGREAIFKILQITQLTTTTKPIKKEKKVTKICGDQHIN